MKKLAIIIFSLSVCFFGAIPYSFAQNDTYDQVRLFQSFFRDAPISTSPYGEGFFTYSNFDFIDRTTVGAQGGYALTSDIEVASGVYYVTRIPDEVDSESGIADVPVYGRYKFMDDETKLSGGVFATIPVGSEDIGEGNLDFGVYGALRHPISEYVVLTSTLGIDFLDAPIGDYEASLNLGGGIIYEASESLYLLGELKVRSDLDYSAISTGIDYQIADFAHLRANVLLGTDDTAPDYGLTGGVVVQL